MKKNRFIAMLMALAITISLFVIPASATEAEEPHTHVEVYFEDETLSEEFKEKAKAYNCYTRKKGMFLSQTAAVFIPVFLQEIKDKHSFFEYTEEFISSKDSLHIYVSHIFQTFLTGKR